MQKPGLVVRISKEGVRTILTKMAKMASLEAKMVVAAFEWVEMGQDQSWMRLHNCKLADAFRIRVRDVRLTAPQSLRYKVKVENTM